MADGQLSEQSKTRGVKHFQWVGVGLGTDAGATWWSEGQMSLGALEFDYLVQLVGLFGEVYEVQQPSWWTTVGL